MKTKHKNHLLTAARHRRNRLLLCFYIFFTVIFFLLSLSVIHLSPLSWDIYVSRELQEDQGDILDVIMVSFSWLGNISVAVVMILLFTGIFAYYRYRYEALFILSCLLTGLISYGTKLLINRPRPSEDIVRIIEETHYQSFPSGHVLFYTAFFGALILIASASKLLPFFLKTAISIFCFLMILFCAVSRVYLGAHWFTDVLGGFILGLLFLMVTGFIYLRHSKRSLEK